MLKPPETLPVSNTSMLAVPATSSTMMLSLLKEIPTLVIESSLKSTSPPNDASLSESGSIIGPFNGLSIVPPESE